MKVFKIIVGVVVAIVVLALLYFMTLDSVYKVERSATINASPEVVMQHIANFKNWEAWSPWREKDPNAKYTFEGPEFGVGASMGWDGNDSVGQGVMTITEMEGNSSMKYSLVFMKPWESSSAGGFELTAVDGGTSVRWYDSGELPFLMRPMGKMMDGMIGPDFEKGLAKLKVIAEEAAANSTGDYKVEEMNVEAMSYYSMTDSVVMADIGASMGAIYGKISAFLGKNNIEISSQPLCITHAYNVESAKFEACIPVAETSVEGVDGIVAGKTYEGPVVKTTHMGNYFEIKGAYEALMAYMKENGKEVSGSPYEIYVTDPMQEPDTNKWITEVYFPVK